MMARGRGRGVAKRSKAQGGPTKKMARQISENTQIKRAITEAKQNQNIFNKSFPVDEQIKHYLTANAKVHEDFSCMLNQTNIGQNNNKFYVIQIVKDKSKFICYTRWGRVGEVGTDSQAMYDKVAEAIKAFEKKFKDKTKNNWDDRNAFTPVPGKYTLIEMDDEADYGDEVDSTTVSKMDVPPHVNCTLDTRTKLMVKLIFNEDMFSGQMSHMKLDVKKMPLGKLSKMQIAKGLEAIIEIEEAIRKNKGHAELAKLSSTFYTLIPHSFGRSVPPVIDNDAVVHEKKEVMITLSDIELALSLQKSQDTGKEITVHPLDEKFQSLCCDVELLEKKDTEFKLIEKYATISNSTRKGKLLDVWRINRKGSANRFKLHDGIKERKLLWHGTNVAVVAAILNSGLRIMPHSSGRVGKGIYFASEHRKSSWYVSCHYGKFEGENNIGFMFLVEVALGKQMNIKQDNCSLKAAPKGYDSVVARGKTEPDSKKDQFLTLDNRKVIVPVGFPVKQNEYSESSFSESEYLVYKESQAKIRYMLKFSFA